MSEERIKSDNELNEEQQPLSPEELEEVAGGGGVFHESQSKSGREEMQKTPS